MDEFGMNFPLPFLSIKKDDIWCVFFHKIKDGIFIKLQDEFQVCFSSVYEV